MPCTSPPFLLALDLPDIDLVHNFFYNSSNMLFKAVRVVEHTATRNRPFLNVKLVNKGTEALMLITF